MSDADTLLAYINPSAKKPDQVAILTREGCGYCAKAKELLTKLGYDYAEVPLPHKIRSRVVVADCEGVDTKIDRRHSHRNAHRLVVRTAQR